MTGKNRIKNGSAFLALIMLGSLVSFLPTRGWSQSVTLGWLASTVPNVAGYDIYYGTSSGNYTSEVTVGNVTSITLTGLIPGTTYYLAAKTYDANNNQSGFSPEVAYSVPALVTNQTEIAATLTPALSLVGGQFSMNVIGVANDQYVVQASTDMVNWTPIATNVAPFTFVDPNAGQYAQRFYRAYYTPPPSN